MAPRPQLRLLTAGFASLCAIALGACGSSGPENGLSQEQSDKLVGALENLQDDVSSGDCDGAQAKLTSIRGDITAIEAEGGVDKEIITGLGEMTDQTDSLLDDCTDADEPEDTTSSSTSTEPEPTTTETETEPTTTDDTDMEPPEEEPKPPPEEEPPPEPPSDNEPPGPEGNPNDPSGGFDPSEGGVSPGQKRLQGGDRREAKLAKPGKQKRKMMDGKASQRADQENETR